MYENLRFLRKKKGVSARELAELLNLQTDAAYYKKENGLIRFSLEEAKIIAEFFQMPVEAIFFEIKVAEKETDREVS